MGEALPCVFDHEGHFLGCYVFGSYYEVPLVLTVCGIQHHNELAIACCVHGQPMHLFCPVSRFPAQRNRGFEIEKQKSNNSLELGDSRKAAMVSSMLSKCNFDSPLTGICDWQLGRIYRYHRPLSSIRE